MPVVPEVGVSQGCHERVVPAILLRGFWDELERRGVVLSALERASGLSRPREGDCSTTIPASDMHRLFEISQTWTGDEFIGLTAGRAIGTSGFHLVGHLVLASGTLPEALDLVARVQPQIRKRSPSLEPTTDGRLRLGLRAKMQPWCIGARIESELTAVVMHDVVRLFFADSEQARPFVELPFPMPSDTGPYRRMFSGGVRFGCDGTFVTFPPSALVPRRHGADAALVDQLLRLALDQYSAMETESTESWTQRVQKLLRMHDAPRLIDASDISGQLGVSVRGLARRLAREDASLSDLLDAELYARARTMLCQPGVNASRVAEALGYAELSSFFRAFRRWSGGLTPTAYRRDHVRPQSASS